MILILLLLSFMCLGEGTQSFSSQPSDVTVQLGADVTLPCVVVNRRGSVQVRDNVTDQAATA